MMKDANDIPENGLALLNLSGFVRTTYSQVVSFFLISGRLPRRFTDFLLGSLHFFACELNI